MRSYFCTATKTSMFVQMSRHLDGPGWRWELARRAATDGLSGPLAEADELIVHAAEYIRLTGQGEGGKFLALRKHTAIRSAVAAWCDPESQPHLKIMILADSERSDIAARVGLDEAIIATVESLFFDVRSALKAIGWVTCEVINAEERAGNVDLATRLRVAYFGGPLVAQLILDADDRIPVDEADRLFDQSTLLHLKVKAAMAVPLCTEQSLLEFTKLYLDYRHKSDKLELAKEKFRHRCEQDLRPQDVAKQQVDVANDREAKDSPVAEKGTTKAA
jgi:hypothetical protein